MRKTICACGKKLSRGIICVLIGFFCCLNVVAQGRNFSWDFVDCELKDILFAVSMDTGISIVPDDTVNGKGDFRFAGENFQEAFDSFLTCNRLVVERNENVWTIGRFSLRMEGDLFCVDAYDLLPEKILEKISEKTNLVLTYDSLPLQKISVHLRNLNEQDLMKNLAKCFGTYDVLEGDAGFEFVKRIEVKRNAFTDGSFKVEYADGKYLIDVKNSSFYEVVEKVFSLGKKDDEDLNFCMISNGDVKLQRSVFVGNDLTDTLEKLCSQAGFSYVNNDNLYYLFSDINARNELITGKRKWTKFSLCYTKSQDFLPLLIKKIDKLETLTLPDDFSFLCFASEKECELINQLISDADIKKSTYLINLKYIKPKDFLEHLPPTVDKNSLYMADENECLYFKGTEESYLNICEQVALCDRPVKRLSYDLLILQYDETFQNNWSSSFDVKKISAGDRNGGSVMLGSVLSFNLNVVSAFGLTFASELQSSIEENATKVFADTTLHGVSGKQINFQNTNTYRYRDNNVNPETGIPLYSGVTKEISSGIKLDILGWVSGDGMITSKVTASVSRQGVDTSSLTGNPPPTTEKIVTTEVCGKSGKPIILSGLVQQSDSNQEKRAPLLSKIPLIGKLFEAKEVNKEKSQMIIYLVPHIESDDGTIRNEERFNARWVEEKMEYLATLKNKEM